MKGLKILVVDDESYIRELLCAVLEEKCSAIETAEDGEVALRKLAVKRYDLVLTDIKMPRLDGFTLLRQIKQSYPDVAVVVMTGFSQEYTIREALSLGAEEYLSKPFRTEEVIMVVERAYWRSQSRLHQPEKVTAL